MIQVKTLLPTALVAFCVMGAPLVMADMPASNMPNHHGAAQKMDDEQMLERHIAHLHDALKVTPQQEEQWKPVAEIMRDNDKTMRDLVKEKRGKLDTQTAVEDLAAYSEIAQAHAVATKKLADVFSVFYVSLSDDQKKVADDFFREHKHHAGMKADHAHH